MVGQLSLSKWKGWIITQLNPQNNLQSNRQLKKSRCDGA